MSNRGTPKFMPSHMNDVLVETWEDLNISYISITQGAFKKTHRIPLFSSYQYTNLQDLLEATKISIGQKSDEIVLI